MYKYLSDLAQSISPYVPGEQPKADNLIKLNTNENPYPPSPKVRETLKAFAYENLRLYPDPESIALKEAISRRHGVDLKQVFVGNGSDEILALAFLAFFNPETGLRFPDISYSFYRVYAELFKMKTEIVPLKSDWSIPIEQFFNSPGGLILANPNTPTGVTMDLDSVIAICEHNQGAVIIDEAYIEFGADSALSLLDRFPNLLIIRTMSKSHSLAGLRAGYAIGSNEMIAGLDTIKNSFNSYPMDRIAQIAAIAAIEDDDYTKASIRRIINTREASILKLKEIGFDIPPSLANFIFISHEHKQGEFLMTELRKRSILVRRFNSPRLEDRLRVSIGTDEDMEIFINALMEIIS